MESQALLKQISRPFNKTNNVYDEDLHARFLFWLSCTGHSQIRVGSMIGRSGAAINQYINKKYEGRIDLLEKDIASLLKKEEDNAFPLKNVDYCLTSVSKKIWTALQACNRDLDMGIVVGPAGCGKTETIREFKRQYRSAILLTADITSRSIGSVLLLISKHITGVYRSGTNSAFLQKIIESLKDSKRLLIIDEAHFLSWEAFEAVRKIHDCAGIGVVFAGQQKMYEQMIGGRRMMQWDQIFSRVGVRCHITNIEKNDVELIARSLCPKIDAKCLDYLYAKACGPGKLRIMVKLLQKARRISDSENLPVTISLLKEINALLAL